MVPTKIEVLSRKVKQDPENPFLWRDLTIELLHIGHEEEAIKTINQALRTLKWSWTLPDKFHDPVLKALESLGPDHAPYLEILCRDLDLKYDTEEDDSLKRILRRARRSIRKAFHGSAFPLSLSEEIWWTGGAHLIHPASGSGKVTIFPGRIIKEDEDVVDLMLMSTLTPDNRLEVSFLQIPRSEIKEKGSILNRCFEMPVNSEDGSFNILFHKKS